MLPNRKGFTPDSEEVQMGLRGEQIVRDYLSESNKGNFNQIDLVYEEGDIIYLIEVKYQELFTKGYGCNFDGHGLSPYQAKERIRLAKKLGAIPILWVIDIKQNKTFYQNLLLLEEGEKFYTKRCNQYLGEYKGRVIYNIKNFNVKDIQDNKICISNTVIN